MVESVFLGDVIDLAIGMEKLGAEFYMQASNVTHSESTRSVLKELAEMERNHGHSFLALKKILSDGAELPVVAQPDRAALRYLESWSEETPGGMGSVAASLTGSESDEDIMRIAIGLEKDSIAYYSGLCEVFTGTPRDTMDRIIREEMDHYATLKKTLSTIENLKSKG